MSLEPSSELPSLGQSLPSSSNLGSLAQSARAKQLKTARAIMIIVGVLTIAFNGFMFVNTHNEVDQVVQKQIQELHAKGMMEVQASVEEFRHRVTLFCQMIYGATVALGVIFVILGIMVYTYPVPATVLGLVLYIGAAAIFAFLNPASLVQGVILKIIVVVALVKSIQAAVAYQRS
jgi:hypothetical protein